MDSITHKRWAHPHILSWVKRMGQRISSLKKWSGRIVENETLALTLAE